MSKIIKTSLCAFVLTAGLVAQRLEAALSSGHPKSGHSNPLAEESTQLLAAAASGGTQSDTALERLTTMAHLAFVELAKKNIEIKENKATLIAKRFQKHFAPLLTPEEIAVCLAVCQATDNAEIVALESDYVNPSLSLVTSQTDEDDPIVAIAKRRGAYLYSFHAGVEGNSSGGVKKIFYAIKLLDEEAQASYTNLAAAYAAFMEAEDSSDEDVSSSATGVDEGWYKFVDQALTDAWETRLLLETGLLSDDD